MKRINILIIASCIIGIIAIATIFFIFKSTYGGSTLYIAVACPLSGEDRANGKAMQRGVQLCFDRAKQAGMLRGKKIELLFFNDQNDSSTALKIASQITLDNRIILVIGHYFNTSADTAGTMYKKQGIPAITASATLDSLTIGNDWYFRVIPNNHSISSFIANFIIGILKNSNVSVIYDEDDYGYSLYKGFEDTARQLGITTQNTWSFHGEDPLLDRKLRQIVSELRTINDPGVIFFATHAPEAVQILASLRYQGTNYTVIGPDSFSNRSFIDSFNKYPAERLSPGYYTDGIYAVSPFLADIGGKDVHAFVEEYEAAYAENPTCVSICYYDAMMVALRALEGIDIYDEMDIRKIRRDFRDRLARFNRPDLAVEGVTGSLYFDENGDVEHPLNFGRYENHELLPAFTQFQTFDANIGDGKEQGNGRIRNKVAFIDGQKLSETQIIYVGIDINKINSLDLKPQIYSLDFNITFRFQGDFDGTAIEFSDAIAPVVFKAPIFDKTVGNITTRTYRIQADFKGDFNLKYFPYDTHKLSIRFCHKKNVRAQMIFSPEILPALHNDKPAGDADKEKAGMSGWDISDISYYQDIKQITLINDIKIPFSRFNAEIHLKRTEISSALKIILPIFILIIILYIVYFIPYQLITTRLLISVSTAVVSGFYHNKLLSFFSEKHLNIEYAFFAVYLTAAAVAGISILSYWLSRFYPGSVKQKLIDTVGKIISVGILLLCLVFGTFR